MIDSSNEEWREALRLVREAFDAPQDSESREQARSAAFDFMRRASSKRILSLAHLLQPGATQRSIQAALVPLERVDRRAKITDAEIGIRCTDSPRPPDRAPFVIVADNIRSAFNAGGLFRTAEFFGAERLVLCGYTPTPDAPQVVKTALGAADALPWERIADVRDALDALRAEGRAIYALETADSAKDIATFQPSLPCALLVGNERFGLDPDVVASADAVLEIPSHGLKNSLNVVSALAVACAFFRAAIR
ncbi:MAG: TrmH family RNA methyltransferase [Kiritimatiellae bacterium]|nr:TrmH family RNA methyltransferase [Kiritimatiellia bacterium]